MWPFKKITVNVGEKWELRDGTYLSEVVELKESIVSVKLVNHPAIIVDTSMRTFLKCYRKVN